MAKLLTLIMNLVRALTGSSQKLDVDDATKLVAASSLPVVWKRAFKQPIDALTQSGYWFGVGKDFSNKAGIVADDDFVKVIVLAPDADNITQFFVHNNNIWHRYKNADGSWSAWNKLGGATSPLLSAIKGLLTPTEGGVAYVA